MTTITLRPGQVPLADLAQICWTDGAAVLDRSFDAAIEKGARRIAEIAAVQSGERRGPLKTSPRTPDGSGCGPCCRAAVPALDANRDMSPDLKAPSDLRRLRRARLRHLSRHTAGAGNVIMAFSLLLPNAASRHLEPRR
jgi:histidine ammonia-lyase